MNAAESWAAPRTELALGTQELDVWKVSLDDAEWPEPELTELLTEDERARAQAFHFEKHRRRFVVGRASLRRILARYLKADPTGLRFRYGERGKPELELGAAAVTTSPVRFNLSHSHGLAVFAVAREREVGVDVEWIRADVDVDGIAARFFSTAEHAALRQIAEPERRAAFFRVWTRKEAYLKAIGQGLFRCSRGFDVSVVGDEPPRLLHVASAPDEADRWSMEDFAPAPEFVGAVLAEGRGWSLRRWRLDP